MRQRPINLWMKRLDTWLKEPTNQNSLKVSKVVKLTNFKIVYTYLNSSSVFNFFGFPSSNGDITFSIPRLRVIFSSITKSLDSPFLLSQLNGFGRFLFGNLSDNMTISADCVISVVKMEDFLFSSVTVVLSWCIDSTSVCTFCTLLLGPLT